MPVLNKMDLPQADPDRVCKEIEEIIGIEIRRPGEVSAKTGLGIENVCSDWWETIPAPKGDRNATPQALIIDSWFDNYLGVIVSLVRVFNGTLRKGATKCW